MRTSLRQVGGSVAMVIPPVILHQLHLQVGTEMQINAYENKIIAEPVKQKPKCSLEVLLAQSDFASTHHSENDEWINDSVTGSELL